MNEEAKAILDTILAADKDTLSRDQMEFVMARREYLNDADKKRFADEIKKHEKGELFKGEDVNEGSLEALDMKTLAAKAKELGIKGISKLGKKELIKEIEAALGDDE